LQDKEKGWIFIHPFLFLLKFDIDFVKNLLYNMLKYDKNLIIKNQ